MSVFDSDIQKLLQSGMVPLYIEYEKAFNFNWNLLLDGFIACLIARTG